MIRKCRLGWGSVMNVRIPMAAKIRGRKRSCRSPVMATPSLGAAIAQAGLAGGQVASVTGSIAHPGAIATWVVKPFKAAGSRRS
jgi:hypothetical protein